MAPEQLAGKPAATRSDIYALGLLLYEIFTGAARSPGHRRRARLTATAVRYRRHAPPPHWSKISTRQSNGRSSGRLINRHDDRMFKMNMMYILFIMYILSVSLTIKTAAKRVRCR
jgi:serine/threonine protein kinase